MFTIHASRPLDITPAWALLERDLLDLMAKSTPVFIERYTEPNGWLTWCGRLPDNANGTSSADDFYEAFFNWPLLYVLGGDEVLLATSKRQWRAITEQLASLGQVRRGYLRYGDQLHLSEAYNLFRFLCLADPTDADLNSDAIRFAGLYLGEDPGAQNFDSARRMIRAPVTGSDGPRTGLFGAEEPSFPWREGGAAQYGLPFDDVAGITTYDDLRDPMLAHRMGQALQERMAVGDVPVNLFVTSLVANAYCLTGDDRYRRWVLDYVDQWVARMGQSDLVPDNVGPSGAVGERTGGKWYGGHYGWTWPFGFYIIQPALQVGASNALLLSGDPAYMALPRRQLDAITSLGVHRPIDDLKMSLSKLWQHESRALPPGSETFVVPYRHQSAGWFDYQPLQLSLVAGLWSASHLDDDWNRLIACRDKGRYDWRSVYPFRTKAEAGHEQPWIEFLAGRNPQYPELILGQAHAGTIEQIRAIRDDRGDMREVSDDEIDAAVHQWQGVNPIFTEALIQLTLGGPQPIYYGGPLTTPVRHFDPSRRRPGLPLDVAALVESVDSDGISLVLVNLNPFEERRDIVQAGGLREHRFVRVSYEVTAMAEPASRYPGHAFTDRMRLAASQEVVAEVDEPHIEVVLPPGSQIRIRLGIDWYAHRPSYRLPWHDA